MSNQAIDPNNPQTNQNPYPQEDNYNMNIQNFNMDIHQQKQIIDNLSKEDFKKKIDLCIKENNLSELVNILQLSQIDQSILSSYISENIQNLDILSIFLNAGANVNSYIHFADYKISESDIIY